MSESGSERSSNPDEQEHDYISDVTSTQSKEINDRYQDLLMERYQTILEFNKGHLNVQQYTIKMAQINHNLHENEYEREHVEEKMIEHEIELNNLLHKLEERIRLQIPGLPKEREEWTYRPGEYKKFQSKNLLSQEEMQQINKIINQIEKLKNDFLGIEEDPEEPLPSSKLYDEWIHLSQEQQDYLQRISGIPPVVRENYATLEEFEQAQENFLDSIDIFFSSYWDHYQHREEREIIANAKRMGIMIPPKKNYFYNTLINSARDLLPHGYILSPGIRKNMDNYIKVDTRPLKQRVLEAMENEKEIAIRLKPDEQERSDQINRMRKLLNTLTDEQLRHCIAGKNVILPKQSGPKNLTPETMELYERLKKYPRPPRKIQSVILAETPVINKTRETSKRRLAKAFTNIPPGLKMIVRVTGELVDNVKYKVELLEDYVFRMLKSSPPEVYFKKIEDLVFILENYPEFKTLLLQGYIDVYRLALFDNVMKYKGTTHVYPVSTSTRKQVIEKLTKEIYFSTYEVQRFRASEILTKILITKKAQQLERFIFDLAQNHRDYNAKIKQLLEFIKKVGKQIFIPLEQLLQEVYIPKSKFKASKECPICTFPLSMQRDICMTFPCNHYFHCDCIKSWTNRGHNNCPVCRAAIRNTLKKSSEQPLSYDDYIKLNFSYQEITALVLQETYRLQELDERKWNLEAKNYGEQYVVFWKPPAIAAQGELSKWKDTLHKVEMLYQRPQPLNKKDKSLLDNYILELNTQRQFFVKKYKLDFIPGLEEVKKKIKETEAKYEILEKVRLELNKKELDRQRALVPPTAVEPTQIGPVDYTFPLINEAIVNSFVMALKRAILQPDLNLVEMYDINQMNKKSLSNEMYTKLNEIILKKMENTTAINPSQPNIKVKILDFKVFNNSATRHALEMIFQAINVPFDITTPAAAIKQLVEVFPKQWNGQVLNDIHGNNLFLKLFKATDPIYFYDSGPLQEYSKLVESLKPGEKYRRPQAFFDNKWYNVEYLDKDQGTGQPLTMIKSELVKNPKTKMFEVVNRSAVRKGRYPFILRHVRTTQEGELMDVWTEVLQSQIKYRTPEFGRKKNKRKV